MNFVIVAFTVYICLSVVFTVWAGQKLYRNGLIFIIDALRGNEKLAVAVNQLLLVGFYLLNIGFIAIFLNLIGRDPYDWISVFRFVTAKLGVVLLVLGCIHFFNVFTLAMVGKFLIKSPT